MKDIDKMTGSEWIAYRADKLDAFHARGLELIPNPKCTTCDVDNDYVCLACEITQVDGEIKMNLIEQAIEGHWGERCSDYEKGCPVCDAWREYDNLVMDNKLSNKLFLEELTHTRADPVIRAEMTKLIFRRELK